MDCVTFQSLCSIIQNILLTGSLFYSCEDGFLASVVNNSENLNAPISGWYFDWVRLPKHEDDHSTLYV
jgi:hypothetical protein